MEISWNRSWRDISAGRPALSRPPCEGIRIYYQLYSVQRLPVIGYITDANTPRPPLALIHGRKSIIHAGFSLLRLFFFSSIGFESLESRVKKIKIVEEGRERGRVTTPLRNILPKLFATKRSLALYEFNKNGQMGLKIFWYYN